MFCDRCGAAVAANAGSCPRCQMMFQHLAIVPAAQPRGAGAWVADGWNAVTANFWTFVLLGLITMLAGTMVPVVLQGPVVLGLYWASLRQVQGYRAEVGDLSFGLNLFPAGVLICLVTGLIIGAATVLLLLPGLVAAALLQFPYLLAADRKLDFWSAIKESFQVSQQHFGSLLGLLLLQICLLIGGVLLCGVGLLVAIPICYAATAAAYVDLFGVQADTRARLASPAR
jgi:hypothetical protein